MVFKKPSKKRTRPRVRKSSGNKTRARKWKSGAVKLGAAIAVCMLPALFPRTVKAGTHPGPPPSPAVRAPVKKTQVVVKIQASPKGHTKEGYNMLRVSQRLTKPGPVMIFERFTPFKGKPKGIKLGLAQEIKIGGDGVAKLGLLSPSIGKGRVDWSKIDFGVMLSKRNIGFEAHRLSSKKATRHIVSAPLRKSTVYLSHMDPGYYFGTRTTRVGVSKLEKTLGIGLGELSTSMGMSFPKGEKPKVDVSLFFPTKSGKLALEYFQTPTGGHAIGGVIIIKF